MLIYINEDFASNLPKHEEFPIEIFESLLSQHARLFHYIAATKKTIHLIEIAIGLRLSNHAKNTLKVISSQSNDLTSLLKSMRFYAEVRDMRKNGIDIELKKNGQLCWICDIHSASNWFSSPLKLIGENITDAKIFSEASRHFAIVNNFNPSMRRVTIEMTGGTGNANAVLAERLKDALAPVLLAIDSDKLCPSHPGSDAIQKCNELISSRSGIAHFHHTDEREVENLLPLDFISGVIDSLNTSKDKDRLLDNVEILRKISSETPDIYSHIDIKNGTCLNWIERKKEKLNDHFQSAKIFGNCTCAESCSGFISPPILEDILEKSLNFMENISPKDIRNIFKKDEISSWLNLGEMVFSMSLSNNVRIT